jgi:hypothetical protein
VLDLLGGRVHLLLALLGSTTEAEDQVESRLLLDVVVRKSAAILELLAGEDQTLLVRRNAFLVLDLRLDIAVGVLAARQLKRKRFGLLDSLEKLAEGTNGGENQRNVRPRTPLPM